MAAKKVTKKKPAKRKPKGKVVDDVGFDGLDRAAVPKEIAKRLPKIVRRRRLTISIESVECFGLSDFDPDLRPSTESRVSLFDILDSEISPRSLGRLLRTGHALRRKGGDVDED